MIQILREYGKTAISVLAGIIIFAILGTVTIGGTKGLLSNVGASSQKQQSNIGAITSDLNTNSKNINVNMVTAPVLNQQYKIDKNNTKGSGSALFEPDDNTANISILKIYDDNSNEYLKKSDFCEYNKANNTITFKKAGTYNVLVEARSSNSVIKKTFKITIPA